MSDTAAVEPKTRRFAVGLGTMGGMGIVALDGRRRFATGGTILPWIAVEVGAGWTPPDLYGVTAGPVKPIEDDTRSRLLLAGTAGVLLYPARRHYGAVRGGFDIGRGVYGVVAYGFEMLYDNGALSWGIEVGVLVQPMIKRQINKVCTFGDICEEGVWYAVPCLRFSIQLYPV